MERKWAGCFVIVLEEEIVASKEAAFFYPFGLVNTKTTIYLDASCFGIYPPLFTSPSGDS